jgi:lysophospholipase L1-like esterase/pimeloyl-ACP methyl ester carboxylesterase
VLFRSENLLVRRTGRHGSPACVITFDSFTDFRSLDRPGFGERFLEQNKIDAIHIISRDNDWYQYAEMPQALAAARLHIPEGARSITYGSSMGGYAALRFASSLGALTSIAISPQFSLAPSVVPFETRWLNEARRIKFRWEGDCPLAEHVGYIFYDPFDVDAQHFALFSEAFNVKSIRLPHAGHPAGAYLAETGMISRAILDIVHETFDPVSLERQVRRKRRRSGQYLYTLSRRVSHRRSQLRLKLSRMAVEANPSSAAYISNLAAMLTQLGHVREAEHEHRRAIALSPGHPVMMHHYATFLREIGDFSRARALAQEVVALAPQVAVFQAHLEHIDQMMRFEDPPTMCHPAEQHVDTGGPLRQIRARLPMLTTTLRRFWRKSTVREREPDLVLSHYRAEGAGHDVDTLVTTTPAPPPFAVSWRRHLYLTQTVPAAPVDLVILGDSLAQYWSEGLWKPRTVFNLGVAADKTQHVLWRMQAPELVRLKPKEVLIIVGTNNLAAGDTPAGMAAGIGAVMLKARELWPMARVLTFEVPPCGPGYSFNAAQREEVNVLLSRMGETINVDQEITCGFAELCSNYHPDGIHFSDEGYKLLTRIVAARLEQSNEKPF